MGKTIVIKIGSSILMTKRNKLDEFRIAHIADQVSSLREEGFGVILVVSGAVACGHRFIKFSSDQQNLRQIAAGVGQSILTTTFSTIFSQKNMQIAQVLLTKDNISSTTQKREMRNLLTNYVELGFIAMINENDVLDMNSFNGNDLLAAEITQLLQAEKLLILSTMEGSVHGVGGGQTKQEAKDKLSRDAIETNILNGKMKDCILQNIL